jgi:hypothetical protein
VLNISEWYLFYFVYRVSIMINFYPIEKWFRTSFYFVIEFQLILLFLSIIQLSLRSSFIFICIIIEFYSLLFLVVRLFTRYLRKFIHGHHFVVGSQLDYTTLIVFSNSIIIFNTQYDSYWDFFAFIIFLSYPFQCYPSTLSLLYCTPYVQEDWIVAIML